MTERDANQLAAERDAWEARCHFCDGPSYPWLTDDETWAKVEPILGQQQACFECFAAAWHLMGLNDGEPFRVSPQAVPSADANQLAPSWEADLLTVRELFPFTVDGCDEMIRRSKAQIEAGGPGSVDAEVNLVDWRKRRRYAAALLRIEHALAGKDALARWERAHEAAKLAHSALGLSIQDGDDDGDHVGLQRYRRAVYDGQSDMLRYFSPEARAVDPEPLPPPLYPEKPDA